MTPGGGGSGCRVVVASPEDWFYSGIEGVLAAEDFEITRAREPEELRRALREGTERPELVLLDERLARDETPALCREITGEDATTVVPVLLYTSGSSREDLTVEALEAGVWSVVREPIHPRRLVALVRRHLHLLQRVGARRASALVDPETGLLTWEGLGAAVPALEGIAARNRVPICILAVGPTLVAREDEDRRRQRELAARLCVSQVRCSDLCGWVNGHDMVIVAYGASGEGATRLFRRLNEEAARVAETSGDEQLLSAGVMERTPAPEGGPRFLSGSYREELLERARAALRTVRDEGGGVRYAVAP